jgi:serine/threonine protein kinase
MAPELLEGSSKGVEFDRSVDIWSLGCIVYELHTGKRAFETSDEFWEYTKENVGGMTQTSIDEDASSVRNMNKVEKVIESLLSRMCEDLAGTEKDSSSDSSSFSANEDSAPNDSTTIYCGSEATDDGFFIRTAVAKLLNIRASERPSAKEAEKFLSANTIRCKFERNEVGFCL